MVDPKGPGDGSKSPIDPSDQSRLPKMLVVGTQAELDARQEKPGDDGNLIFAVFEDVTEQFIAEMAPEIVISNLMDAHFDALDLAKALALADYSGKYRAISVGIANPNVIAREIRNVAPSLDFELFQLDGFDPI